MCHNPLDRISCKIVMNTEIAPNIFDMRIEAPGIAKLAVPGQFVNLYCKDAARLIPRPISICDVDKETGVLRLIYAVVGEGTIEFATYQEEDDIDVLGPLGNGFDMEIKSVSEQVNVLIVGGGVGTPPLVELSKNLVHKHGDKLKLNIVLGFRDETYLVEEFKQYGDVYLATDSGKHGFKGNVIELMNEQMLETVKEIDMVFSCGPTPMLKGLQNFCKDHQLKAQFSLEERMGCGFGGCVGCVVAIKNGDDFDYKKVCKDGPVFEYSEVMF